MGRYFSDKAEEGIRLVWTQYNQKEIMRGVQLLAEATNEGDADALCFLARCLMGPQYVWEYAGTQSDDEKAAELVKESVRRGSACGVLVAMRCGELTPAVRASMPFSSLKEARDIVLKKAEEGHPFCQYMIGNTYFWGDVFDIDDIDPAKLYKSQEELESDMSRKAIPWFEKALEGRMFMAAMNLNKIYCGDNGLPADQGKQAALLRKGAEMGSPMWQERYADMLYDKEEYPESLKWYSLAAAQGQLSSWYSVGFQYEHGQGMEKNLEKAVECYQKGAEGEDKVSLFCLGRMTFFGKGTPQDYAKAVYWLNKAADNGNDRAYPLLGQSCLKGLGVAQDFAKAKSYFEKTSENSNFYNMALNGLGEIYADGLGVSEDIPKGIQYFQSAIAKGSDDAKVNMSRFKKSLFGKWSRR